MSAARLWLTNATVHTGERVLPGHGVLLEGGRVAAVGPADAPPEGAEAVDLAGAHLAPGFVDLQVNGGGGVLLDDEPTVEGLRRIADAHAAHGTTSLLATAITGPVAGLEAARAAVARAVAEGLPGVLGLHQEGPFLDPGKRGAHPEAHLRPPTEADLVALEDPAAGERLLTLSARHATPETCARLLAAGVHLSLGHTTADADEAAAAFGRGVRLVTHLFNAMTPLASRAPGVVGAALADDRVRCGLIADGLHVHPTAIAAAWRAKPAGGLFLVSDAISLAASDRTEAHLGGQRVRLVDGRCVNDEGALAGSAITLLDAVRVCVRDAGIPLAEALRMASTHPADALGRTDVGRLAPGARADLVALGPELDLHGVWRGGRALG